MKTLKVYCLSGMDWHDTYSYVNALKVNGSYNIEEKDRIQAIVNYMYHYLKDYFPIKKEEFKNKVIETIKTNTTCVIPMYSNINNNRKIEKNELNNIVYYEHELEIKAGDEENIIKFSESVYFGQCNIEYVFFSEEFEDTCYLVAENFLAPTKGVPSVERMYVDLFEKQEDAEEYAKTIEKHDLYTSSEIEINPVSKSIIQNTIWYQQQKEAIKLVHEKNCNWYDENFRIFTEEHLEVLKKL